MIKIQQVLLLIGFHYIADIVFQTDKRALNKSKRYSYLFKHTLMYTLVYGILMFLYTIYYNYNITSWILFMVLILVTHTQTDYKTSRLVKNKYEKGEYYTKIPNRGMYSIIGLDQLIHYIQIFGFYYIFYIY